MDFDKEEMNDLKKTLDYISETSIKNAKITKFVSAIVSSGYDSLGRYDVYIPPDTNNVLHNLINKTGERLNPGDSVEICTKNGQLNNAWIAVKHGYPGVNMTYGGLERYSSTWWIGGRNEATIMQGNGSADGGYHPLASVKTASGNWDMGSLSGSDNLYIQWVSDTDYGNGRNNTDNQLILTSTGGYYFDVDTTRSEFRFNKRIYSSGGFYAPSGASSYLGGGLSSDGDIVTSGQLKVQKTGNSEANILATNGSHSFYMYNNPSYAGIYDSSFGSVIQVNKSNGYKHFYGTASTADNLTDTGWVNLTIDSPTSQSTWNYAQVRKYGKIVHVRAHANSFNNGQSSGTVIFSLPSSAYWPSQQEYFYGYTKGQRMSRWWVRNTDGKIGLDWCINISNGSTDSDYRWHEIDFTWFVD